MTTLQNNFLINFLYRLLKKRNSKVAWKNGETEINSPPVLENQTRFHVCSLPPFSH